MRDGPDFDRVASVFVSVGLRALERERGKLADVDDCVLPGID